MKSYINFHFILALILLVATSTAEASIRVVLRTDYGKSKGSGFKKIWTPIDDVTEGFGHLITGAPLGGKYDLFIQSGSMPAVDVVDSSELKTSITDTSEDLFQIFRCPTLKKCQLDNASCVMQPQFWRCEMVFEAGKKEVCRHYKNGLRAYTAARWVAENFTQDLIFGAFAFLGESIIFETLTDISDYYEIYELGEDLMKANCQTNGLSQSLADANNSGIIFVRENKKESAHRMITIMNSKVIPDGLQFPPHSKSKVKALPVFKINPLIIENGFHPLTLINKSGQP